MKKHNPGCWVYIGDEILPNYVGIIINNEIRIPIKQPWEPTTIILRGYNPYFRDKNLHFSWFWGPREQVASESKPFDPKKEALLTSILSCMLLC